VVVESRLKDRKMRDAREISTQLAKGGTVHLENKIVWSVV